MYEVVDHPGKCRRCGQEFDRGFIDPDDRAIWDSEKDLFLCLECYKRGPSAFEVVLHVVYRAKKGLWWPWWP